MAGKTVGTVVDARVKTAGVGVGARRPSERFSFTLVRRGGHADSFLLGVKHGRIIPVSLLHFDRMTRSRVAFEALNGSKRIDRPSSVLYRGATFRPVGGSACPRLCTQHAQVICEAARAHS